MGVDLQAIIMARRITRISADLGCFTRSQAALAGLTDGKVTDLRCQCTRACDE